MLIPPLSSYLCLFLGPGAGKWRETTISTNGAGLKMVCALKMTNYVIANDDKVCSSRCSIGDLLNMEVLC